jgi:hypothetical protein
MQALNQLPRYKEAMLSFFRELTESTAKEKWSVHYKMPKTICIRVYTLFQCAALLLVVLSMLSGRHPSANAQSSAADIRQAVENQHRDDFIADLHDTQIKNAASIQKQWDAMNQMKAEIYQIKLDEAASTKTSTWFNSGTIIAILASLGFQVKTRKDKADADGGD